MVAYSFDRRFVEPILANTKRQTIRRLGRRRHARVGEALQLYTGLRTQHSGLIARRVCGRVQKVMIYLCPESGEITEATVDGRLVSDLEAFARADGFAGIREMSDFWGVKHGPGRHGNLLLIGWRVADADTWNRLYPAGTIVRYYPELHAAGYVEAVTYGSAWTLDCGEALVSLIGMSGGKALSHLEPVL